MNAYKRKTQPTKGDQVALQIMQTKAMELLRKNYDPIEKWILFKYPITRSLLPIDVLVWGSKDGEYWLGQITDMVYKYDASI